MANKKTPKDLEKITSVPVRGGATVAGETTSGEFIPTTSADMVSGTADPARTEYYRRVSSLLGFLKWFIPIALTLGMALAGFYVYQVREPVIRLDEKFTNLEKKVEKQSTLLDELEKFIYTIRPQETPAQLKSTTNPPQ